MSSKCSSAAVLTRNTALLALALCWAAPTLALTATTVAVTGAVQQAKVYDTAALSALTPITQTDTFASGAGTQTHTYQGASLWSVLNNAGIVTNIAVKNDVLNRYVVATGTDGYKVVYSLGELNPNFGNQADLVAYAEQTAGTWAPLGSDGFARTTAPSDIKGGRYVSNLAGLNVQASASTQTGTGGGASTQFTVSGQVHSATTFNLSTLQSLPSITQTVGSNTYTGVSLWSLLNNTVGVVTNPSVKNDILGMYVVATGSDGYKAVFSMGELNPAFGNQPDLIAYDVNGQGLGANGFARLVAGNDVKAGRWVSNLVSLEVFSVSAVPEPGAWAMFAAGGLLAWMTTRRPQCALRPRYAGT